MEVKNINGTSDKNCNCSSWIKHWEKFTGNTANVCKKKGCTKTIVVGAHVIKCNSMDAKHYIIPFCHEHNQVKDICLEINKDTDLAPANKNLTCY